MQPFQQRVVEEKQQLDDKIIKLNAFFRGDVFKALPDPEQYRLYAQVKVMAEYSRILGERIAAFV